MLIKVRNQRLKVASTLLGAGVLLFAWEMSAKFARASEINFARDVRPILSENCFKCHGPDDAARVTGMRLDTHDGLLADVDGETVVAPGDFKNSLLYARITNDDPDLRMPPRDSNLTLNPQQIETIRRWIASGAEWEDHWSLQPIRRPPIPQIDSDWPVNPIDQFVLQKLIDRGLTPAPEAERFRLLRRVTLDLTGLPPTPAEVTAFLSDEQPGAYERVVDRLLASPAYGERMAWDWLDAARYADTNGYQGDRERTMWPWRDWVVQAFNANHPFHEFTIDQLAGDLRPEATTKQKLATGFCRNHMINGEGGRIAEENRVDYVMDMSETMGTVWLGLTLNCCRCHDHKFDPISNREYYSLLAFFNQTPVTGAGGDPQTPPVLSVYSELQESQLAALESERAMLEQLREMRGRELIALQPEWERRRVAELDASHWKILSPDTAVADRQTLEILKDGSVLAKGEPADRDTYTVSLPLEPGRVRSLRVEALRHESLTKNSLSRAESGNFVLTKVEVALQEATTAESKTAQDQWLPIGNARATFEQKGHAAQAAIDEDPQSGWAVWEGRVVDREHAAAFDLAEPVDVAAGTRLVVRLRHESVHARHNLGRFRISVSHVDHPQATVESPELSAALRTSPEERTSEQHRLLRTEHESADPEYSSLVESLARVRGQREAIERAVPKVMVMADQAERRPTFLLNRGLYNLPGEEVQAGVPQCLPPLEEAATRNRLGLAEWLVSDAHPLTARVTVNRFWQQLFGQGLVRTPEDFGVQGETPDHADLLDWLADDFRSQGWDVKRLMRMMVLSRTYRQSSPSSAEHLEQDPENRLLARGPRYRLPAWMLRDQALAVSGLLTSQSGGPAVNGYQPPGVWEEATFGNKKYVQDQGAALYRRSLYTFWRRIIGPTMFFDNASRQTCTVKQVRTNTPLHSLLTLNDVTYVEAARALAEVTLLETGLKDVDRLKRIYLRVLARPPQEQELAVWLEGLERSRGEYQAAPEAAQALLSVGESPREASLEPIEHAAWTALCLAVLNLDETLSKE